MKTVKKPFNFQRHIIEFPMSIENPIYRLKFRTCHTDSQSTINNNINNVICSGRFVIFYIVRRNSQRL